MNCLFQYLFLFHECLNFLKAEGRHAHKPASLKIAAQDHSAGHETLWNLPLWNLGWLPFECFHKNWLESTRLNCCSHCNIFPRRSLKTYWATILVNWFLVFLGSSSIVVAQKVMDLISGCLAQRLWKQARALHLGSSTPKTEHLLTPVSPILSFVLFGCLLCFGFTLFVCQFGWKFCFP